MQNLILLQSDQWQYVSKVFTNGLFQYSLDSHFTQSLSTSMWGPPLYYIIVQARQDQMTHALFSLHANET